MAFRRDELRKIAESAHIPLNEPEVEDYEELVSATLTVLERIQEIPEPKFVPHEIKYPERKNIHRPEPEDNPHNVWVHQGQGRRRRQWPTRREDYRAKG